MAKMFPLSELGIFRDRSRCGPVLPGAGLEIGPPILSRGLLFQKAGFFRMEYHFGFLHQADRDDLIQRAQIRQRSYTNVGETLAVMRAASDSRHITYL
jgi:hypothetical protein